MRTHRFEPVSLIFGLVFAGIGLVVLQGDDLWSINWSWFWPVALTVAGLTIALSARPKRNDDAPQGAGDTEAK
jgi:hypothetical protein